MTQDEIKLALRQISGMPLIWIDSGGIAFEAFCVVDTERLMLSIKPLDPDDVINRARGKWLFAPGHEKFCFWSIDCRVNDYDTCRQLRLLLRKNRRHYSFIVMSGGQSGGSAGCPL